MNNPYKVILTGATGMVGEGVLHACLNDHRISEVLIITRRNAGIRHPKLKEIIYPDLYDLSNIDHKLAGYNACLFCIYVPTFGKTEARFYRSTYMLTMHFAETLVKQNDSTIFCYLSGAGTDSTEKGHKMWA